MPIVPAIRALADAYHKRNLPVIMTRHASTHEDAGLMGNWWRSLKHRKMQETIDTGYTCGLEEI